MKNGSYFLVICALMILQCLPVISKSYDFNDEIHKDSLTIDSVSNLLNHIQEKSEDEESPISRIVPPSPQASKLAQFGTYPVSHSSGVPDITIPIYSIKLGKLEIPISISYHASGIKANEIASTVGLGWSLDAGGAIVREVCGGPDLENLDETYFDYEKAAKLVNEEVPKDSKTEILKDILYSSGNGSTSRNQEYDCQSDRYTYNFAGHSGKFRYSYMDGEFYPIDGYSKMLISGTPSTDRTSNDSKFYIVDTEGNQYYFNRQEYTGIQSDENTAIVSAWYLTDIVTPYGKVKINYVNSCPFKVGMYQEKMRTGVFTHYDESRLQYKEDGSLIRASLLDALVECDETRSETQSSEFTYRTPVVSSIEFNGGEIQFSYKDDRKDIWKTRLEEITVRDYNGNVVKNVDFNNYSFYGRDSMNYRMMLESLVVSDQGKYSFTYNKDYMLPGYVTPVKGRDKQLVYCQTDYWGYFNGNYTRHWIPKEAKNYIVANCKCGKYNVDIMGLADRQPNLKYAKCGTLTSVTYPTGGKTVFEYEANDYNTGGLRIESISNYNDEGLMLGRKNYKYNHSYLMADNPFGTMHYQTAYWNKNEGNEIVYKFKLYATTLLDNPLSTLYCGSPVFYSVVTEEDASGDKIRYTYDSYPAPGSLTGYLGYGQDPQLVYTMLNDFGNPSPVLTQKEYIDSLGEIVMTESYDYEVKYVKNFSVGVKICNFLEVASQHVNNFYPAIIPTYIDNSCLKLDSVIAHSFLYHLKSKTVTYNNLGYSQRMDYTYDGGFRTNQPESEAVINSDGKKHITSYDYAFESDDSLTRSMAYDFYCYDEVVGKKLYCDGNLIGRDKTDYKFITQNDYFYPERSYESYKDSPFYEKYHYLDYDAMGNLLWYVENGSDTTNIIWGYRQNYPTEVYKNGRLKSSYTWKPLVGVTSITAENGYKTDYGYDNAGRLNAVSDYEGVSQRYEYQYMNGYGGAHNDDNYVKSIVNFTADGSSHSTSMQYCDELGRPRITATDGMGGKGKYVYTMQEYDSKGRNSRQWLPAVGDGSVRNISDYEFSSLSSSTYNNDGYAYSDNEYDALDRPTFTQTPGAAWHHAGKGVRKEYVTNDTLDVRLYEAPMDGKNHLVKSGFYRSHMLFGERTTDEDGHSLTVFTDKLGRKVLERRASDTGNNDTYFVYNDLGQLRFVLSPEYQNNGKKAIFGYEYRYDERGNIVKKFLPQCEYIQYWYDNDNRLIYMQDGRMRGKGLYRFYLYDKLSRVVVEGTCTSCNRGRNVTRTTLDTKQSGFLGTGYVIGHDLRLENPKLEVVNYYDNYNYLSLPLAKTNHGLDWQQQITSGTNTTGLVTGTYSVASDNSPLLDVFCYNAKGQIIQSYRVLSGNSFLKQNTKYTFTGKQENVSQLLFKNGRGYTTETVNSYNKHNDQLESAKVSVNGTQMKISALEYDDLGRIKSNAQGQTSTEYTYNIRGWTTDIVNPKFEEHLTYNDGSLGTPYFSGNISTQQWKTADDNILRGYKFTYDKLNRLTNSEYGEGTSLSANQGRYSESIQGYTANGAITKILRNGLTQKGSYGAIDDLSISLNGNQLASIEEKAAPVLRAGSFDFRKVSPPSDGQAEYHYDANGALIYDANRGITSIEYDLRNNPRLIQFSDGSQTEYVYSALGEKLKTIHRTAVPNYKELDGDKGELADNPLSSDAFRSLLVHAPANIPVVVDTFKQVDISMLTSLSIDSTEYIGSFIFENGHADKYLFPGGYYSYAVGHPTSTGGDGCGYYYYLTDHLGNNRVVVNANGDIEQTTHYYPFGAVYADAGKSPDFQKFKYTGKELDLTHGLNTYDHGARQNYSILGVWDRIDPLAEKYYNISPYVACGNNPIILLDSRGTKLRLFNNAYDLVIHTLPEEERRFVQIDSKGFINQTLLRSAASGTCSNNLRYLNIIVQDKRTINYYGAVNIVHLKYAEDGNGNFKEAFINFTAPTTESDLQAVLKTYKPSDITPELISILNNNGIFDNVTTNGVLGKTLRPDNEQGSFPNPGERSLSQFIEVYTNNVGTTSLQQVLNAGHELYSHVIFYLLGLDPRHYGSNNEELIEREEDVSRDIKEYNR